MTLRLELTPEKAAEVSQRARAEGVSVEQLLQTLIDEGLRATKQTGVEGQDRRPLSARIRELWAEMPDEVRAEFPEGGARQIDHHVYGLPKK